MIFYSKLLTAELSEIYGNEFCELSLICKGL